MIKFIKDVIKAYNDAHIIMHENGVYYVPTIYGHAVICVKDHENNIKKSD